MVGFLSVSPSMATKVGPNPFVETHILSSPARRPHDVINQLLVVWQHRQQVSGLISVHALHAVPGTSRASLVARAARLKRGGKLKDSEASCLE